MKNYNVAIFDKDGYIDNKLFEDFEEAIKFYEKLVRVCLTEELTRTITLFGKMEEVIETTTTNPTKTIKGNF